MGHLTGVLQTDPQRSNRVDLDGTGCHRRSCRTQRVGNGLVDIEVHLPVMVGVATGAHRQFGPEIIELQNLHVHRRGRGPQPARATFAIVQFSDSWAEFVRQLALSTNFPSGHDGVGASNHELGLLGSGHWRASGYAPDRPTPNPTPPVPRTNTPTPAGGSGICSSASTRSCHRTGAPATALTKRYWLTKTVRLRLRPGNGCPVRQSETQSGINVVGTALAIMSG